MIEELLTANGYSVSTAAMVPKPALCNACYARAASF